MYDDFVILPNGVLERYTGTEKNTIADATVVDTFLEEYQILSEWKLFY